MGKGAATLSENGDFVVVLDSEKLDREREREREWRKKKKQSTEDESKDHTKSLS